jgi:hypothetical protein
MQNPLPSIGDALFSAGVIGACMAVGLTCAYLFARFVLLAKKLNFFMAPYLYRRNPYLLQLMAAPGIGRLINENSKLQDRILVFGYASTVYLYARRRAALEFLEGSLGVDPEIANSAWGEVWPWWVCRDIHKFSPSFIVDMDGRLNIRTINQATGLDYRVFRIFGGCFNIYKLMDGSARLPRFGPCLQNPLVHASSGAHDQQKKFNQLLIKTMFTAKPSIPAELDLFCEDAIN